jgi:hypothetical protein
MQQSSPPNIKELLLGPGSRFELPFPPRRTWKRRLPIDFSHPDFK